MGRLFVTENGRIHLSSNEEIARWRWVCKTLTLPSAAARAPAELWMALWMYARNHEPLVVEINNRPVGSIRPSAVPAEQWVWQHIAIPAGRLRAGVNQIVLRSDNPAMNGWILAVENGHRSPRPRSAISFDHGRSWRSDAMGVNGSLRGEYVVRLRSFAESLKDARPPRIVYENPNHPRVRELREFVPPRIRRIGDPWKQTLALRTFVAGLWKYCNQGSIYAPWDPLTIVDWANRGRGHGQDSPITMCVHYAIVMVSLATSLGLKARCIATTGDFNTGDGHFVTEVWDPKRKRWVLHDPNFDMHFEDDTPLSAIEVAQRVHAGQRLNSYVRAGRGMPRDARLRRVFRKFFATGRSYPLVGVWTRNDYISDPPAAPPAHGSVPYAETAIVWFHPPQAFAADRVPMFPYRATAPAYFNLASRRG